MSFYCWSTYICVCHRAREMEFLAMSLQNSSSVLLKKIPSHFLTCAAAPGPALWRNLVRSAESSSVDDFTALLARSHVDDFKGYSVKGGMTNFSVRTQRSISFTLHPNRVIIIHLHSLTQGAQKNACILSILNTAPLPHKHSSGTIASYADDCSISAKTLSQNVAPFSPKTPPDNSWRSGGRVCDCSLFSRSHK